MVSRPAGSAVAPVVTDGAQSLVPEGATYDRRRAWLIVLMIVAFMVINHADKSVLGLAAIPIMEELDISKSTYGLISSSFYLLFSLSGLVVGFFSTRIPTRTLLVVMAALWAVAQLPVLLAASVPALIAGRVLLGAAEGPAASMSMHALYKWFPQDRRGLPSALHIGGAALGTLIAAPVLTWLIGGFGWRSAFVALAVVSALWCLVWLRVGREGPFGAGPGHGAVRAKAAEARPAPTVGYRALLLNGTVAGGMFAAFGAQWALALASAWLPVYLGTEMGMTPGGVATTISGVSALSLVLLLSVPPLVDVLKARGVSSRLAGGVPQGVAVLLAGGAMALIPFTGSTALRLVLIATAFGAHAVALPLHYVTTAEVVPAGRRGAVFGVVAASGTLPGLFVPFLAGRLIDGAATEASGYTTVFLLTAAVMAACGAFAVAAVRPERDAARLAARAAGADQEGASKPVAQ